MSVEELVKHYKDEFLDNPTYSYVTMDKRVTPDIEMLMKLYKAVVEKGGFKAVTANCEWSLIHRQLKLDEQASIFELYKKYLFHYEKIFNESTVLCLDYKTDGVTIEDLDPNYLIPIKVFDMEKPEDLTQEAIKELLAEDVCVIRNFDNATEFNKKLFEPENIIKDHPDDLIDIVTQDPKVKTF